MMESVNGFFKISAILMALTVIGCQAKQAPTQVCSTRSSPRLIYIRPKSILPYLGGIQGPEA